MTMTIQTRLAHLNSGNMNGQTRHDQRAPGHVPDYVDKLRIDKNSVLIEPPDADKLYREISKHRKAAKQQALRKDARLAMTGIITFGEEAVDIVNGLSVDDQNQIFTEVAKKVAAHLDRELIGLVVHRDETNVHAHYMLRGYKYDLETGQELPTRLTKADTRELQDVAAEPVALFGIKRGTPKEERIANGEDRSKWDHIPVKGMHQREAADKARIAALETRIEKLDAEAKQSLVRKEKNERLADKARLDAETCKGNADKVAKRLEAYERREAEAKANCERLDAEKADLEKQIKTLRENQQHIRKVMPVLDGKKPMLGKGLIVSDEGLDTFHDQVAGYIASMAQEATKEARQRIEEREAALASHEHDLERKEAGWHESNQTLMDREKRLDNVDALVRQNTQLKATLDAMGMHIGKVLGIENASMNNGKIATAMAEAWNMAEFKAALKKAKLVERDNNSNEMTR